MSGAPPDGSRQRLREELLTLLLSVLFVLCAGGLAAALGWLAGR